MEMNRAIVPFEVKAAPFDESSAEFGQFSGYGSTFGNVDFGGDIVAKGAFTKTLEEWSNKKQLPLMPWYHNMKMPIGDWLSMSEDEKGLRVEGQLWVKGAKRIEQAQVAYNLITGTGPKSMSIGYTVKDYEVQEFEGEQVRLLKEINLLELSVLPFGMNPGAVVTEAKSLVDGEGKIINIRSFEKTLREAGLSRTQAKTLLSGGYKALCDKEALEEKGGFESDSQGMSADDLAKTILQSFG